MKVFSESRPCWAIAGAKRGEAIGQRLEVRCPRVLFILFWNACLHGNSL